MSDKNAKPTRGRPKTLDRMHVLHTALSIYWKDGPTGVSINELCEQAQVSKPGLYREFGSDDGLKVAVLDYYHEIVLTPMYEILARDAPFGDVVAAFIEFVAQDRHAIGVPAGCLQVSMRTHRSELGALTGKKVDELRGKTLGKYAALIESMKAKGELSADVNTEVAALFFDTQNVGAMRMQKEGVPNETIKQVLRQAFSSFG